jgi:hypothetical protein
MIVCSQVERQRFNPLKILALSQSPGNGDGFSRALLETGIIPPGNGDD